jgi:hypothetical protein
MPVFAVSNGVSVMCFLNRVPDRAPRLVCSGYGRPPFVWMTLNGRVSKRRFAMGPVSPIRPPDLEAGQRWTEAGFRCIRGKAGLTCRNQAGHGWWLGKRPRHRIF